MCLMCQGWTADEVNADTDARIRQHGWTAVSVYERGGGPTWTYTIGLADRGHPELLVANAKIERAMAVITDLATRVVGGESLADAEWVTYLDDDEAALCDVHPVHVERGLVGSWQRYYDWRGGSVPALRVRQVVLPDDEFCGCHKGTQPRLDMGWTFFGAVTPDRTERRARRPQSRARRR
jgi:Domain of unknown function (DUF4262)